MSKKKLLVFGGGGVVVLLLVYFAAQFVLFERSETDLFYHRGTGDFIRVSPMKITIEKSDYDDPPDYRNREQGRVIEVEYSEEVTEDQKQPYYFYQYLSKNAQGGFDLEFSYRESPSRWSNEHEGESLSSKRSRIQSELDVVLAKDDGNKADQYIIPVIDDSGIKAMDALRDSNYPDVEKHLNEYLSSHPDDLFGRILELDLASKKIEEAALQEKLDKFKTTFKSDGEDLVNYTVQLHEMNLAAMKSKREGLHMPTRGLAMGMEMGFAHAQSFQDLEGIFLDYDQTPNFFKIGETVFSENTIMVPNFLNIQTLSKVKRIESDYFLMQGNVDEAEENSLRLNRMSVALVGSSNGLIGRFIGIAVNSITIHQQHHTYLNGFHDAESLREAFARFDEVYREYEIAVQQKSLELHQANGSMTPTKTANSLEPETRAKFSLAHMANLHTAISIRYDQLKYNASPTGVGELLEEASADPFSTTSAPLKVQTNGQDRTVYSIGPDQVDNNAQIQYDPSNGTVSSGDIILEVPLKRKYPFPDSPQTYRSREELLAQYPNGLPSDPFADTRGRSYIITDTSPPIVWSNGPDADQRQFQIFPEEYTLNPEKGFGAAKLRDGTWMKMKNNPEEPFYDPSNGTISTGNLYLNFR